MGALDSFLGDVDADAPRGGMMLRERREEMSMATADFPRENCLRRKNSVQRGTKLLVTRLHARQIIGLSDGLLHGLDGGG